LHAECLCKAAVKTAKIKQGKQVAVSAAKQTFISRCGTWFAVLEEEVKLRIWKNYFISEYVPAAGIKAFSILRE
jgi:hypothetical protein